MTRGVWIAIAMCLAGTASALAAVTKRGPPQPTVPKTEMIRIPGGPFVMGSDSGPEDRRPAHRVELQPFWIDRTPVTNAQFAVFLNWMGSTENKKGENLYDWDDSDARIHAEKFRFRPHKGFEKHPVVEVIWFGARDYCRWAGKRLPTEAEWERAAKGLEGRPYPRGKQPPKGRAQFDKGWNDTAPVDAHPNGATPEGVLDMAGNAYDWVSSLYWPYPYDAKDGREDLTAFGDRGTRGGAIDDVADMLSTTERGQYVSRNTFSGHHHIAFRCARSVD